MTSYTKMQGKNNSLSKVKAMEKARFKDRPELELSDRDSNITFVNAWKGLMEQVNSMRLTENFSRKIRMKGKIQMKMLQIKDNVTDHRFLQCAYWLSLSHRRKKKVCKLEDKSLDISQTEEKSKNRTNKTETKRLKGKQKQKNQNRTSEISETIPNSLLYM